MTTMQVQDIKRKKSVANRYAPNSYRIFDESISNQSLPYEQVYAHQEPQLYTQPLIVPAQSIEARNNPHAGRHAGFLRENVQSLNEPINQIQTRNDIESSDAKKWWQWNTPKEEMDSALKNKKRFSGVRQTANPNDINNYSTTYTKDMGYLTNVLEPGTRIGAVNENNGAAQRYTYNQNGGPAVGVVPINDLNTYSKIDGPQRVFVDKMSFEHGYDSRTDNNYNQRGRRQGAFVIESTEPRQPVAFRPRPPSNQNMGSSVWNAMHPNENKPGDMNDSRQTSGVRKMVQTADKNDPNKRRDPIGYFNDEKFGGSLGFSSKSNSRTGNRQEMQGIVGEQGLRNEGPESYNPSWNNHGNNFSNGHFENSQQNGGNEFLNNAMNVNNYQNPYSQEY